MVEVGGIGKGGRATAAEEMNSTDSGGNDDQAAAANCGGGGGSGEGRLQRWRHGGWAAELGGAGFRCLNFGYEESFVPES
jgi:hypothetical protein